MPTPPPPPPSPSPSRSAVASPATPRPGIVHKVPGVPSPLPHDEVVVILDFGSQTAQLIARRVREAGAFSILMAPTAPAEHIATLKPKGIILSGGPSSVYETGAPKCDPKILELGIPVLGSATGCNWRVCCWGPR